MHYTYKTRGTCSSKIEFDLVDDRVENVHFTGGCEGNLTAIPILIDGWKAEDIVEKLKDVRCGTRPTSCSAQLAAAISKAAAEE